MERLLKRILLVEDEPDIRLVASMALETVGGFEVIACESGDRALEQAPAACADLILLDVMMPGMDGPATLRQLRSIPQTAATPVAFLTAKVQPHEIEQLKRLGAIDIIAKPFDPMTLADQVRELWRRRAP